MAMINCKECGIEMSDKAKYCPKCGTENTIMFCPDCGKQLSSKAITCPNCGRNFENNTNSKGTMFGLSIAAFVCSFFYIASIVGFIMGLIVLSANKEKKCTARSFGIAAVAISSVWLGIFIIFLLALGL